MSFLLHEAKHPEMQPSVKVFDGLPRGQGWKLPRHESAATRHINN